MRQKENREHGWRGSTKRERLESAKRQEGEEKRGRVCSFLGSVCMYGVVFFTLLLLP
jgi:hypothetical protein